MLRDDDWGVRMAAARALGPIDTKEGRNALYRQATGGETRGIRMLAARMLKEHAADWAAARIAKRLVKLKKEARIQPIEALGIIGTPAGVEALSKQMRAPDPDHRMAAARALGRLGVGEKALARGLKDKETDIRYVAASALARVDSDSARATLLDFVQRARKPHEVYILRRIGRHAAAANPDAFAEAVSTRLAKTKSPHQLLVLAAEGKLGGCAAAARGHLGHRDALTRAFAYKVAGLGTEALDPADVSAALGHKDRRVRYAAAEAWLATAGDGRGDALRAVITHKTPDVAMVGVRKAVELRAREALPALADLAHGKTPAKRQGWQARVAACVALGRVGWDEAFPRLVPLTKAREWWLKAAAYEGLYHSYTKEVIPLLIDAFDDRHPVVRMTAKRNLRYMTGKHYVQKKLYESWWKKWKDKLELKHPEKKIQELDKYGYASKKFIQDVLRGTDIVAVKGRWDKVEKILEDLEVKHQAVRAQQIKDYGLSAKQIVLVNCEGSVDSETTRFLQWFVVAGGYMATTDWALVNATTKTFPRVVGGYTKQSTGNDVVIVEPAAPDHPTLKGVFHDGVDLQWWLEIQAFPILVEDPIRSTVLVDSLQMLTRYGSSAMMVEFPAGLGKVLHSTSHFFLQKEGFAHETDPRRRMIFAVDNLGLTIEEVRELAAKGVFRNVNDTTAISKSYSMFHILVNYINEKRQIDLTR